MNYYPFNSRNAIYKNKRRAVASDESLTLRLLLHKDAHVYNAYLCIKRDGEEFTEKELTAKEWCEDYRFYDTEITLSEGLYWYGFRYTSEYGEFFVIKDADNLGIVSRERGELWQQTVYDKDFCTPQRLSGGVIYQIFPDRFSKSTVKKLNVPSERFITDDWEKQPAYLQNGEQNSLGNDYYGGDLLGIKEKLPYLKSLGVTAIYLNPIFEAHSNHRYNTADYMKIDPLLGTERDFSLLCKAAKKHGIAIIIDGVFSHTGDDSIYFNKYKRYGDGGAYNYEHSRYRDWYKFGENGEYSCWWGVKSLPEVDELNKDYLEFITGENGVVAHWLDAGADGVRLDVADELPDPFLEKLRKTVKGKKPDAFILGEVWEDATNKISYGNRRKFLLGHQLDSVMNYPFRNAIIDFVRHQSGENLLNTVLSITENYPPMALNLLMNHIGTHDTPRILTVLSRCDDDYGDRSAQAKHTLTDNEYELAKKRLFAAAVLQYTLPGIPSLFYGDEAGVTGCGDPFCRATYPWGKEDQSLLDFYKALGKLRGDAAALKSGEFKEYSVNGGLFSFLRLDEKRPLFCAVNVSSERKEIDLPQALKHRKNVFGVYPYSEKIVLNPYEYSVIY